MADARIKKLEEQSKKQQEEIKACGQEILKLISAVSAMGQAVNNQAVTLKKLINRSQHENLNNKENSQRSEIRPEGPKSESDAGLQQHPLLPESGG
jgi:hypothetical protein